MAKRTAVNPNGTFLGKKMKKDIIDYERTLIDSKSERKGISRRPIEFEEDGINPIPKEKPSEYFSKGYGDILKYIFEKDENIDKIEIIVFRNGLIITMPINKKYERK